MDFRLIYRGSLPSNGNAKAKQSIRRALHPQLKELWKNNVHLSQWMRPALGERVAYVDRIADHYATAGFRFVPLITQSFGIACKLDILFLRREAPGQVVSGGDIDNRIKTFFDGLKTPANEGEAHYESPTSEENPFFTLIKDDGLITEVRIETDRLLEPKGVLTPADEVMLIVKASTEIVDYRVAFTDMGF